MSCPSPLLKKAHLQPVAQDYVQVASEYPHNLSGQPIPVLAHPSIRHYNMHLKYSDNKTGNYYK